MPWPPTAAVKSWIFFASSMNRARVRPLLPSAFTTLLTTSRKKRPAVHACAAKPSALLFPPMDFRNASTDLFCFASSNGTKNSDAYWPSTSAPLAQELGVVALEGAVPDLDAADALDL